MCLFRLGGVPGPGPSRGRSQVHVQVGGVPGPGRGGSQVQVQVGGVPGPGRGGPGLGGTQSQVGGVPSLRSGGYPVSVKGKFFDTRFGLIHVQTGKKILC